MVEIIILNPTGYFSEEILLVLLKLILVVHFCFEAHFIPQNVSNEFVHIKRRKRRIGNLLMKKRGSIHGEERTLKMLWMISHSLRKGTIWREDNKEPEKIHIRLLQGRSWSCESMLCTRVVNLSNCGSWIRTR